LPLSNDTGTFKFIRVTARLGSKHELALAFQQLKKHVFYYKKHWIAQDSVPWPSAIAQLILPTTGTVIEITR